MTFAVISFHLNDAGICGVSAVVGGYLRGLYYGLCHCLRVGRHAEFHFKFAGSLAAAHPHVDRHLVIVAVAHVDGGRDQPVVGVDLIAGLRGHVAAVESPAFAVAVGIDDGVEVCDAFVGEIFNVWHTGQAYHHDGGITFLRGGVHSCGGDTILVGVLSRLRAPVIEGGRGGRFLDDFLVWIADYPVCDLGVAEVGAVGCLCDGLPGDAHI